MKSSSFSQHASLHHLTLSPSATEMKDHKPEGRFSNWNAENLERDPKGSQPGGVGMGPGDGASKGTEASVTTPGRKEISARGREVTDMRLRSSMLDPSSRGA